MFLSVRRARPSIEYQPWPRIAAPELGDGRNGLPGGISVSRLPMIRRMTLGHAPGFDGPEPVPWPTLPKSSFMSGLLLRRRLTSEHEIHG